MAAGGNLGRLLLGLATGGWARCSQAAHSSNHFSFELAYRLITVLTSTPPARLSAAGVLLVIAWLGLAAVARAQEEAPEPSKADASTSTTGGGEETAEQQPVSPVYENLQGKIEQVGPDTYILLDGQGRPQPVVNMQMGIEQFIAAWKNQQAWTDASDSAAEQYTVDECQLRGTLAGSRANLHAAISITLHQDGMVEVPLSLAGSLLERLPEPPANQQGRYLRFEAAKGGYLATVSGQAGNRVQVELDLITPIRRDGSRATLRLLAPRAVKSSLELKTSESVQSVVASEGVQLNATSLDDGGTRIVAEGVAGETSVSWVDRPRESESRESALSAGSKQIVILDGRQIRQLVRLTVESAGQSFRDFTVRLPRGAQYKDDVTRSLSPPLESIKVIREGGEKESADGADATELLVTLMADQTEPATVDFETIQPMPTGESSKLELSGFEVMGALPQEGEVAVVVDPAWQLRWEPNDGVRPVHPDELDLSWSPTAIDADEVQAAFLFSRQPWSLATRMVERQRRVIATREYDLQINANEALLRMEVQYRIEGGRTLPVVFSPRFALAGWELQRTTATNIEGLQEEGLSEPTTFAAPAETGSEPSEYRGFDNAYATSRLPVVNLEFRRSLPEMGKGFKLELPYPDHDAVVLNPSDVTVMADASVKLRPTEMATLAPVAVTEEDDVASGMPPGQVFRYRGVSKELTFAGEREMRPRRTIVGSEAKVQLASNHTTVDQTLALDIRHQATSSILLTKPNGIEGLELFLLLPGATGSSAGTPLEIPASLGDNSPSRASVPEVRVPLVHPRLGQFRIRARYRVTTPRSSDESITLPLLSVPGAESTGSKVSVESTLPRAVAAAEGSSWHLASQQSNGGSSAVELRSDSLASFMPLWFVGPGRALDQVNVERIWVQTWLTPAATQVRTVFEFRSDASRVRIELPADAPNDGGYEVVLDDRTASNWTRVQNALEVDLPATGEFTRHVLEVRYRLPESLGWTNTVSTDRPRLVGSEHGADWLYWQVIAPVEYQPVSAAQALLPAYHPEWSGWDWHVESEQDTLELEQWIGASERLRPSKGEHAILYRGDYASPLTMTLVRRELLVLGASSLVLLGVSLLAYVPSMRRASTVLAAVCVLAAIGLAAPQWTASVARLGLYGVLCGLATWVLWLMFGIRTPQTTAATPSGSIRGDASSFQRASNLVPLASGSQSMSSTGASTNAPTVSLEWTDSNA